MSPSYKLEDFMEACRKGSKAVTVLKSADDTAKSEFRLKSKDDLIHFIGSGGISGLELANNAPWDKNPNKEQEIMVDSYDFFAGSDYGYLAFMFQPVTSKWLIKSFKKNNKPDPRNNTLMGEAFKKALKT